MAMRIAIDYTPATSQRAGIGRYTRGLVHALGKVDRENLYTLLIVGRSRQKTMSSAANYAELAPPPGTSNFDARRSASLPANFRHRRVRLPYRLLTIVWHRLRLPFPAEALTGPADLFHSPDFVLPPLRRARGLITVHDLAFLRVPACADPRLRSYLAEVVPRSVARSDHILADSESTRRDLIELLGTPPQRITVVPAGVDPSFRPHPSPDELRRASRRYNLEKPFILSLGTIEPRKNYVRLIEAHALLRDRLTHAPHLLIAGTRGWLYEDIFSEARLRGGEAVRFLGFVPDEDLPALYAQAQLFAFPSLYEGFGLPPLEAMACGTPVVCSDRSSLPEIVGDAALMVDAEDAFALAAAMQRTLEEEGLRARMIARGLARARLFTWEEAARKLRAAYQESLQ